MRRSEVAALVAMLLQAYPQAQFGPASAALYEQQLADLEPGPALVAVQRLIRTSKWLPTVAEIRAAAVEIGQGPRRLGAEAWGDVTDAVRRIGSYRAAPDFTDPLVTQAVRMLGWRNLCLGANDVSDRARFIELYDGLQARARADVVSAMPLPAPAGVAGLPWRPRALPEPAPPRVTAEQRRALAALDEGSEAAE